MAPDPKPGHAQPGQGCAGLGRPDPGCAVQACAGGRRPDPGSLGSGDRKTAALRIRRGTDWVGKMGRERGKGRWQGRCLEWKGTDLPGRKSPPPLMTDPAGRPGTDPASGVSARRGMKSQGMPWRRRSCRSRSASAWSNAHFFLRRRISAASAVASAPAGASPW